MSCTGETVWTQEYNEIIVSSVLACAGLQSGVSWDTLGSGTHTASWW